MLSVITGLPRSGKSTLAAHLAAQHTYQRIIITDNPTVEHLSTFVVNGTPPHHTHIIAMYQDIKDVPDWVIHKLDNHYHIKHTINQPVALVRHTSYFEPNITKPKADSKADVFPLFFGVFWATTKPPKTKKALFQRLLRK